VLVLARLVLPALVTLIVAHAIMTKKIVLMATLPTQITAKGGKK